MMRTLRRPLARLLPPPGPALAAAGRRTEQAHPGTPAERGDLPPVGDGAHNTSVPEGASG
ncbi:hypothetical protein [Streptomyces sp. NPDC056244]|uniref:hypothetical protein n=1 Tax=unclassified Streptomyces TaxID=2593676 RepID=UPI0035E1CB43